MYSLKPSSNITCGALLLLVLSFIAFIVPEMNVALFFSILLIAILGTYIKLEFIGLLMLSELALGGHGYLFSIDLFGFSVSLRVALFVVAFVGWSVHLLRARRLPRILNTSLRIPILIFLLFILIAIGTGIAKNPHTLLFYDANAYLALGYLFFFTDMFVSPVRIQRAIRVLVSSAIALSIATIAISGVFTIFHYDDSLKSAAHITTETKEKINNITIDEEQATLGQKISKPSDSLVLNALDTTKTKPASYRWLRDTGTAEVSYISGRFFRVFFPSHIVLLIVIPLYIFSLIVRNRKFWSDLAILFILSAALYVSFSRSLWLGAVVAVCTSVMYAFFKSKRRLIFAFWTATLIVVILFVASTGGLLQSFTSRVATILNPTEEVAGLHRVALLSSIFDKWKQAPVFGSGFGTAITFPTVLPNGDVVQTAFLIYEWSYFDLAVKAGLLGLIAFLVFLVTTFISLLRRYREYMSWWAMSLFSSLLALSIANITTPVFTHPLGLGALAFVLIFVFTHTYETSNSSRHME